MTKYFSKVLLKNFGRLATNSSHMDVKKYVIVINKNVFIS